ncbi:MAG: hypothetical protein BGO40_07085 [Chryseobacterium sp. 39-10]|nr:MAG: hypothetical protein BGO40_07085 [Chryseobacterium sp. 39-10]
MAFYITAMFSAQQEVSTDWAAQANTIFSPLDKSRVPDGILLDYGMEFTNVPAFNGALTDSTYVSSGNLKEIYNTLLMSRIRDVSAGFVMPETFENNWQQVRSTDYIALSGLYFKYGAFADDALSSGKIQYTGGKFYDVAGKNPYVENKVFAIASPINTYTGYNVKVKLSQNTFYTNTTSEIQKIEIDFGDGAGFKILPNDQLVSATYNSEGIKTWTYKLTLTSGQTLLTQNKIQINQGLQITNLDNPSQAKVPGGSGPIVSTYYYSKTITASDSYPNTIQGKANLIIDDAGNNGIRKPLIVVTGFDMDKILNPENLNGQADFKSFKSKVFNSGSSNLYSLLTGNNPDVSGDQVYDIIFIKWQNGMDYIQNNAYVLEEVIKWVNQQKAQNGSTEKNVVIGQSMGGLVARYALRNMEQNGLQHQTRLFVNQDGPQQGANIPLSYQAAYRHVRNMYAGSIIPLFTGQVIVPILGGTPWSVYFSILDQPATRQLLKNRMTTSYTLDNSLYNSFQTELRTKGYPINENIRNIAISNASECGNTENFNAGDKLLGYNYYKGLSFWGDLLSLVYNPIGGILGGVLIGNGGMIGTGILGLVPGHSTYSADIYCNSISYNQGTILYHNKISYTKKILWIGPKITVNIVNKNVNQPSGILPFDYYPGGFVDLKGYTGDLNPPVGSISGVFNFTLVPGPSALDIGSGNVNLSDADYKFSYNGANPPASPLNTPFANFITGYNGINSQNGNESHLQLTKRNGDWLAGELNNSAYTASCAFMCVNAQISGESVLCSTGDFSYSVPAGADFYNWSVSGGYGITFSGNGTSTITLTNTNNYNGSIILNVTLGDTTGKCGQVTLTKTIWIGKPRVYIYASEDNSFMAYLKSSDSNATLEEQGISPSEVTWRRLPRTYTSTGFSCYISNADPNQVVEVKIPNSCGTITLLETISFPPCESYMITSNTDNTYNLIPAPCPDNPVTNKGNNNPTIIITDIFGREVVNTTSMQFSLQSQLSGTYYARVIKDGQVVHTQTLIKH